MLTASSLSEKYFAASPEEKEFQLILKYVLSNFKCIWAQLKLLFPLSFDCKVFKKYVVTNFGHPWGIPIFDLAYYVHKMQRLFVHQCVFMCTCVVWVWVCVRESIQLLCCQ